ncbi:HEAT repeat domain-containing protein [Paludisphaera mucosa]|uniref:HEAT repeat domain-containing protein n=1 Tax=Paludisphaera mucosa TaxID=3030827 RepID=A0ABT6FE36_9BACT|nr:HEAT repeat domain-containing protein [Paludisphaera mucosa]MDG3005635.1 HEAT repeat domain-containing protein [Paludisphaera mucosa]
MPSPNAPGDLDFRTPRSEEPGDPADLPDVEMPSAGFVLRLFVIPALVVAAVVAVWLLFGVLAGGRGDALQYVREIRSGTGSWRSAFELANLLQGDPKTATDPRILGELTDMLGVELDRAADPRLAQYLALAIGTFRTLDARLADGRTPDPLAMLARALDGRFDSSIRLAAAASLARQGARLEGGLDDPRVIVALGDAANAADSPELRRLAVFALGFCGGEAATGSLRGRLRSDDDRFVRYNAAIALTRRGDASALAILREMLGAAAASRPDDESPDLVETIQLQALEALAASKPNDAMRQLRPEIEALARTGSAAVRTRAESGLQFLQSGRAL